MVTNPESNVKLSDEQTKQLEAFESRLAALRSETTVANQNLRVLQDDCVKAAKEKAYQESLLAEAELRVAEVKKSLESLESSLKEGERVLTENQRKSAELDENMAQNKAIWVDEKSKLAELDAHLEQRVVAFHAEYGDFVQKKEAVEKAAEALKVAIQSVTWK